MDERRGDRGDPGSAREWENGGEGEENGEARGGSLFIDSRKLRGGGASTLVFDRLRVTVPDCDGGVVDAVALSSLLSDSECPAGDDEVVDVGWKEGDEVSGKVGGLYDGSISSPQD